MNTEPKTKQKSHFQSEKTWRCLVQKVSEITLIIIAQTENGQVWATMYSNKSLGNHSVAMVTPPHHFILHNMYHDLVS